MLLGFDFAPLRVPTNFTSAHPLASILVRPPVEWQKLLVLVDRDLLIVLGKRSSALRGREHLGLGTSVDPLLVAD